MSIICCSKCKSDLIRNGKGNFCDNCNLNFNNNFVLNSKQVPKEHKKLWKEWEEKQNVGKKVYEESPEDHFATDKNLVAKKFCNFIEHKGIILDVGCGLTEKPAYMKKNSNATYYGIDPLPNPKAKFHFYQAMGEYLPFKNNSFDAVIFGTSLEHCYAPVHALKETYRVLKPDGKFYIWFDEHKKKTIREKLNRPLWEIFYYSIRLIKKKLFGLKEKRRFQYFTREGFNKILPDIGFKVKRSEIVDSTDRIYGIFLEARKK